MECALWTLALKHLELKPNITVLDIGSGAGFPLMELASRLGNSCKLVGIDPWKNANNRAFQKVKNYGLRNVEIIEDSAEKLPFYDASIDLIVSNLGINNFENPDIVFRECQRVLKEGGRLALTTNLNGHWQEFYDIFEKTLIQLGKLELIEKLTQHQENRGSVESISRIFTKNGFKNIRYFKESFTMNFMDGSAFLNHHFVKPGWMRSW